MSYFESADEVYRYLGGVFRQANDHPEVGPLLKESGITLRLDYTGPDSTITVVMKEPEIVVIEGDSDIAPDVRLAMSADNGDKFWRGEYNVAVGLAKGHVKAKGPVTQILKLIPMSKPLFPVYRELVAEKGTRTS